MPAESLSDCFNRIAALPPEDRASAIAALQTNDAARAREIISLLAHEPEDRETANEALLETFDLDLGHTPGHPKIAGYRILEPLATGGQSTVYLAEQTHPRRMVAIKILRTTIANPSARDRFVAESQLQGTIRHPAIVSIHSCGLDDAAGRPMPWIAMELVPEARPISVAAERDDWSRQRRLDALATVADAIHEAHLRGIVHRDLKPGNILVGSSGRVRVIDFGIARLLDAADRESMTREGDLLGTIRYLAPEQLSNRDIDARADIYSLGVLTYELLLGASPYGRTATTASMISAIQRHAVRVPEGKGRSNRDLTAVLTKALAGSPEDRYESMAAFARDLRALARSQRVDARHPGILEEFRGFISRNPLALGLSALLVVASIVGLVANSVMYETTTQTRRQAILGLADAAIARGDAPTARQLLATLPEGSTRDFAADLLRSSVPRRFTPLGDWGQRKNLYGLQTVPGTSLAVTLGSSQFGLVDLADGETRAYLEEQDAPGGEFVLLAVDPTSDGQMIRFAAVDSRGCISVVEFDLQSAAPVEATSIAVGCPPELRQRRWPAAYLPDGRLAISPDGTSVELHELDDLRSDRPASIVVPTAVPGQITAITAADQQTLIIGTNRGGIRRLDLLADAESRSLFQLGRRVDRIVMAPDGTRAVAIGSRRATLFDPRPNRDPDAAPFLPVRLEGPRDMIWNAAFQSNGSLLALSGRDGRVHLHDGMSGDLLASMSDASGPTWSSVWFQDALIVSTEREGIVRFDAPDLPTDHPRRRVYARSPDGNSELRFEDGRWLIASDQLFMISSDESNSTSPEVRAAAVADTTRRTPDESTEAIALLAVVATSDRGMIGIDQDRTEHLLLGPDTATNISQIRLASDGRAVLWLDDSKQSHLGRLEEDGRFHHERLSVPHEDRTSGEILPDFQTSTYAIFQVPDAIDGASLLLGTPNGTLHDARDPRRILRRTGPDNGWLLSIAIDPVDRSWYAGDHEGSVSCHSDLSGADQPRWSAQLRRTKIIGLALHPDRRHLAALGSDGIIDIIDVRTGRPLCSLGPVPGEPVDIRIDDRGETLSVHTREGEVRSWGTPPTGREVILRPGP